MSTFTHVHLLPIGNNDTPVIGHRDETVTVKYLDTRVALSLTAAQFRELAAACNAAADAMAPKLEAVA